MRHSDPLSGPERPQLPETSPPGQQWLPLFGASERLGSRTSEQPSPSGNGAPATSLGASHWPAGPRPPGGHKGRSVPGSAVPAPTPGRRGPPRTGRGRRRAGSVRQGCLHRKGRLRPAPREGTGGPERRRGAHAGPNPPPGRTAADPHLGGLGGPHLGGLGGSPPGRARGRFPASGAASPQPRRDARGSLGAPQSFFPPRAAGRLTWEPGHQGAEREKAGVQGRRGPRHGGGAARGPGAGAAAACPARGRDHSARGRAGVGGGCCAGPRPAATIPPAAESRQPLPRLAGRDARESALGTDGPGAASGRGGAVSAPRPQLGLRDVPSAEAAPRAAHSLRARPPPLPALPAAAGLPFPPPSSLLPSLRLQAPARPPHGPRTAGRGELPAGSAPAGDRPGLRAAGGQVGAPSGAGAWSR